MSMHRPIVAFVDTSDYATSVCDYSAWLAARTGFEIELVHVIAEAEKPSTNMSGAIGLGAKSDLLGKLAALDAERAKLAQEHGRAVLAEASARISAVHSHLKPSESLRTGSFVEAAHLIGQNAKLIVVGKRGEARGTQNDLIGSNLEAVIRASQAPVLVANRAFVTPKRFLLAFDGGPSAQRAVDHIASNSGLRGMEGILVAVGEKDPDLKLKIEAAAERLSVNDKPSRVEWRDGNNVEDAIASAVDALDIDLLVMGAYGHSRIRNWVIGSTTTAMIQRCKVPVLMFR